MAENYGTLEGTLDEHGVLSGEMSDRATLEGEIQFGSGGGGVLDVFQNGQSVVEGRYAYVTVPTFLKDLRADDYHNTVTTLEIQNWNGKADSSDIPTALSQLDNDDNYVQDADYVHTDNNFTDEDKAAIGNIPENITDLSDVAVDNIQNGQVLKWDATQEKFVNANESGGGGDITDVKVDGTSVVDPVTGEADIDLTGKADKVLDAVAGDFAVLLANGNVGNSGKRASDMASKAEMSVTTSGDQTTIQLKSGTSATVINQHQDISGKADKSSLGTAAEKDSTALIVVGSTDLAEAGAVREAIDSAVASSYHHAGTKTCAELVASLLVKANEGNVYNMTDSGTTTSDFIESAGLPIRAGDNVGVAKIDENTYKFDLLSGFVDTSNFITKSSTNGLVKNDGSIDTTSYQPTESGKGLSTNDYDNIAKGKVDALGTASTKNVPTSGDAGNNEVVLGNDTRLTDARPASDVSAWAKESTKPSYTKSEVGLGNVDNTSDSTKKTNFTGSIASGNTGFTTGGDVYTALGGKADKVSSAINGNLAGLNNSGNLTDSGWNGAKDTTSISGNPISISGLKSNQLAVNPIITLEPIQAGSGTPSPSNIRAISGYDKVEVESCGKNLFDPSKAVSGYISNNTGALQPSSTSNSTDFIRIKSSTTYKRIVGSGLSGNYGAIYDANKDFISGLNGSQETFTTQSNAAYVRFTVNYDNGNTNWRTNVTLTEDTTATTYVPYVKATSISESLGQTVYGGSLDVRTGLFTVTHGIKDMGDLGWNLASNSVFYSETDIGAAKKDGITCVCSCYNAVANIAGTGAMTTDKTIALMNSSTNLNRVYVKDTSYSTASNFKTAVTGQKLVYELATPFTIQLTPHEISLLSIYAYVSTNGTSMAFSYHNGELASLSDTAQIGESLNALGDYITRESETLTITLANYDSAISGYLYLIKKDNVVTINLYDVKITTDKTFSAVIPITYSPTSSRTRVRGTIIQGGTVKAPCFIC